MKHDRLQVMKELMLKKREVTTAELCDTFGVSIETIRRDLNVLEREGVIRKVYGGPCSQTTMPRPRSWRHGKSAPA